MSTSELAPALEGLTYVKGNPIDLEAGRGKKGFVIEFWATWCPPCRTSIPHLTEIAHKFKDTFEFVGVTTENEEDKVKAFVDKMGDKMDYAVALDTKGVASEKYMSAFHVSGIPHAFIVDISGKIAWHGHPSDPEFETKLTELSSGGGNGGSTSSKAAHHYTLEQIAAMTEDQLAHLSAKDLRGICQEYKIDVTACLEKSDYVAAIQQATH